MRGSLVRALGKCQSRQTAHFDGTSNFLGAVTLCWSAAGRFTRSSEWKICLASRSGVEGVTVMSNEKDSAPAESKTWTNSGSLTTETI
jgi:hypothetical protein